MSTQNQPDNAGAEDREPEDKEAAGADLPSAEAELDESNTENVPADRPFSSKPAEEASGQPEEKPEEG